VGDAGYQHGSLARKKVSATAGVAVSAISSMPPDTDPLTFFPPDDICADRVDNSNDFMPGHPWVLKAGESPFFCERIAVAYPTCLNLDSHLSWAWLRDVAFDNLEGPIWSRDLYGTHLGHKNDSLSYIDPIIQDNCWPFVWRERGPEVDGNLDEASRSAKTSASSVEPLLLSRQRHIAARREARPAVRSDGVDSRSHLRLKCLIREKP
jgi:hypothetical protein